MEGLLVTLHAVEGMHSKCRKSFIRDSNRQVLSLICCLAVVGKFDDEQVAMLQRAYETTGGSEVITASNRIAHRIHVCT